jgi:hypothetical protein
MRNKAVAVHAVVLVVLIGLFLFITLVIFFQWYTGQNILTNKLTCTIKLTNYCIEWSKNKYQKEPYSWDEKDPKGCEKDPIKIGQPTEENCKALLHQQ